MADATNRRRTRLSRLSSSLTLSLALVFSLSSSRAQNVLPTHGVVASGAASISQSGANLSVTQTTPRAIVNWGSFSIGRNNSVTFDQPSASSAILNRVTGSTTSAIAGQLDANGQVYLVNPNGIAITRTGAVRVGGGFVASTLGISDQDFSRGNLDFAGGGASAGVDNAGSIQAAAGGFVGLLGGVVSNSGVISVPLGKVAMGSGEQATLNLTGDNFLQVAVPTGAKTADGHALVDVSGKISAAGGLVQLKAATVARAIRDAVNVPGEISATSAYASGGSIILGGGPGGNVVVKGRLAASGGTKGGVIGVSGRNVALNHAKIAADSARGRGGSVTVTATNAVNLIATAIDASGATGGGAIRVGGDFHGASDVPSAQTVAIDSGSTLNASATQSGDGGTVAVWSNALTNFGGRIEATGGPQGGDGGSAEVSANPATKGVLSYTGLADLTAPRGAAGTLLLDPYDIVISTGADSGGTFSGGVYTPTATSVINATTLETQLGLSNVIISTGLTGSPGADAGNITVSAPVAWATNFGLTLIAANAISVNASITDTAAGSIAFAGPTNLSANVTTAGGGIAFFNAVTLGANATVSAGGGAVAFDSTVDGGSNLTVSGAVVTFFDNVGSITPLGGLSVTGLTNLNGNVTTNNGAITFNNALLLDTNVTVNSGTATTTFGGAVDSSCIDCAFPPPVDLTASAGALSFGGALGGTNPLRAVSLTSTNAMALPPIFATTILAQTTAPSANLTLGPGTILTASGPGTPVTLAAGLGFINQSGLGPGAINLTTPGARWLVYSANPANGVFGGLDSGNTAVWNTPFGGTVTAPGDRYVFAFQPAITVTSTNDIKTFGQDVTSRIATDYIISGLQPGVAGAYLGDPAAAVYSGAPSVTSLGSPAMAPFEGSPYPITVGLGSLVIGDGYGFVANSAGLLTVLPVFLPSDPGMIPGLTQISSPTPTGYDVGGFTDFLPEFVPECDLGPNLPDPNRFRDPDVALKAISQALENFFRRCENPTKDTIADALDKYAAALAILAPRLPPALRNIPAIVSEAAHRVRAARTRMEAVAVLRQTIAAVHKEISLVRSEDPETRSRVARDSEAVAGALNVASLSLVNSGGL